MYFLVPVLGLLLGAQVPQKNVPDVKRWEADVRLRIAKDTHLTALAAKHPLVVLHSLLLYPGGNQWAYSFIYETWDPAIHFHDFQIRFNGGAEGNVFEWNKQPGQQDIVVCLGQVPFDQDPDPTRIMMNDDRLQSFNATAIEGHTYLQRVRDEKGNNFYVLFRVVAVDANSRFMAFLWRRLPGGKVVQTVPTPFSAGTERKPLEARDRKPEMRTWEMDVRKRLAKNEQLRTLSAKYPLVLLHSRSLYAKGDYKRSAFSFNYETSENCTDVQLLFDNGSPKSLSLNMSNGQRNLAADLGTARFEQDP